MYTQFKNKEHVVPANEKEKSCLQLINDVDAAASHVQGSVTSKKHMRNEIWSLINKIGSPSWFITISPADVNHPICLYFADVDQEYKPEIQDKKLRECLIKQNPVAAARFFDFMVQAFIKHVLGVGSGHNGLYGKTEAYYGTVEQQGHLTLHLRLLLWIKSSLSPQEIRDQILKHDSDFIKSLISYLESCYVGEFDTGTSASINEQIILNKTKPDYKDPTLTMPTPPPVAVCSCSKHEYPPSITHSDISHSQTHSHCLFKYKDMENRTLNFIGKTLPRSDKGDREYYCCVALSLFKPWRDGSELREAGQTWEEAFNVHIFTEMQIKLMANFNLRYECNDSRDDYSALRKRGQTHTSSGPGFDIDNSDDTAMHEFLSNVNETYNQNTFEAPIDFNTEDLLPNNGILDPHSEKYKLDDDVNTFCPDITIDSTTWKQKVAEERSRALLNMKHNPANDNAESNNCHKNKFTRWNEVVFDDLSYIDKDFQNETLNEEQHRAFKIITNHSTSAEFKPLKMYIGGMGGTGKSKVIYSLCRFFCEKGEGHAMVVCAPTGTAAALVHGLTYHSLLGFSRPATEEVSINEDTGIKKARDNLDGVKYIFIDEISGNHSSGFGGYSVIFAGDFAQLPPVGEETGKALWHQVTHVVILRKNMQQQAQSLEDLNFRLALENM
ncbi:hypothetical protein D9758_003832 [Tetrapyrgos nigripes]|uniref:ATP-dependent DNA helicase n=1 Tax=Tetrapyrgos nigripes TaxID=182062 RepID=A0A8H5LS60_9AGAR|nr:hypothetical protein D9758_003832 [Tetrapyrgos nigripes]